MKRLWSFITLSLTVFALLLPARAARAADDEGAKLAAHGKALRYTLKTTSPPSPIDMGGAAILVNAPIASVRKIVTSYGAYQTFLHPFDQSRVLSKRKGVSEVYLQVPILHGAVHIWTVADLSPPAKDGAGEIITARFKRGNVSDFRANWRLRAVDSEHTIVKLELLVEPKIPFPSSVITTQLVSSAETAVTAVRDRAQAPTRAASSSVVVADTRATTPGAEARAQDSVPNNGPRTAPLKAEEQSRRSPETATEGVPALPRENAELALPQANVARR